MPEDEPCTALDQCNQPVPAALTLFMLSGITLQNGAPTMTYAATSWTTACCERSEKAYLQGLTEVVPSRHY
jgi:hypothetical protein